MTSFYSRYHDLFLEDRPKFQSHNLSLIKPMASIFRDPMPRPMAQLEGYFMRQPRPPKKVSVSDFSTHLYTLEKDILPKLQELDRRRLRTDPTQPKYSMQPMGKIDWRERDWNGRISAKNVEKVKPQEKAKRYLSTGAQANQQEIFRTTVKRKPQPVFPPSKPSNASTDIQLTLKKIQKELSPAPTQARTQTRRPTSTFLDPPNAHNQFQFLQQRLKDLKYIQKFYTHTDLNDYRSALERRRDAKRSKQVTYSSTQRKQRIVALLLKQAQLRLLLA